MKKDRLHPSSIALLITLGIYFLIHYLKFHA